MDRENLGMVEPVIQTLLTYSDHLYHNRPGIVTAAPGTAVGLLWHPAAKKVEGEKPNEKTNVYRLDQRGTGKKAKTIRTLIGTYWQDGTVRTEDRRKVAEFREAGIFPEVAAWAYQQVANVWSTDNEFAARWASFAFADSKTPRDMKVVLAAFMLCQSRRGDPVYTGETEPIKNDEGVVLGQRRVFFNDDDYRDVGEAMVLIQRKGEDFNAKLLLRIREVLTLESVAKINRELGFGRSAREPFLGRWYKVVTRWLRFREQNPKVLAGLIKSGNRLMVIRLAKAVGYKPVTPAFFKTLRWEQTQASGGHRSLALGEKIKAAETWDNLSETEICERIIRDKPAFKWIAGRVPNGLTRAIVAAAVEAGSFSGKDLIIFTPTLEELGLLKVQEVKEKLEAAVRAAEDQRAAHIARNVQSKEMREKLQEGAERAVKAAVVEEMRGIRVYFMVDTSASMNNALEQAKVYIKKLLVAFPAEQIHISVFKTSGREIVLKHSSEAGVDQAFRGITSGGGTDYGAGVRAIEAHKPKPGEDALFIFVGDEEAHEFTEAVRRSGLNPMAFGFVKVRHSPGWSAVTTTATMLGIPCFMIDERTFADPYAIPRTIRTLVAATPVGQTHEVAPVRVTLVDRIMKTELLKKPVWAELVA